MTFYYVLDENHYNAHNTPGMCGEGSIETKIVTDPVDILVCESDQSYFSDRKDAVRRAIEVRNNRLGALKAMVESEELKIQKLQKEL